MDISTRKERFSFAYVSAVAACSGYSVDEPTIDNDSIDGVIGSSQARKPRIEFQLKATALDIERDDMIRFDLSLKNYEDLRADCIIPRILVVVLVPEKTDEWILQTNDQLCMRRCGYWTSLSGEPPTRNRSSVRISIPKTNRFDRDNLTSLMDRASTGEYK